MMTAILLNPYKRYDVRILLPIGLTATIAGSLLAAVFGVRYDGILDMHVSASVSFWRPFFDNITNIGTLFIFLFVVGKLFNSKTRLIDIFTLSVFARLPYYVLPFLNIQNVMGATSSDLVSVLTHQAASVNPWTIALGIIFTLITLVFTIWYMVLLYNGFKVAVHANSVRAVISFIFIVLLAEVLSKYLILNLL